MKILISIITYLQMFSTVICLSASNHTNVAKEIFEDRTNKNRIMKEIISETELVKNELSTYDIVSANWQVDMAALNEIEDKKEWFEAYKKITFKYIKWFDAPDTVFDVYTSEEVKLICRMVETECYDQSFDAKCNVASVVFNRLADGRFGEDINEIITSPRQFTYWRESITEDTILAVQYVFEIEDTTGGALYFHNGEKRETFNKEPYLFTDDAGHNFYGGME